MMLLKNIKATCFLSEPLFEKEKSTKKMKDKIWHISIIVYYHSPSLVNLTGLRSFEEYKACKLMLEKRYNVKIIKSKIDCCFFSHKETRKNEFNIDLRAAYHYLKDSKVFFVSFEPEIFAGLVLKPYDKFFPSVLLFRTGSYTIMGGKTPKIIKVTQNEVLKIIQKFNKVGKGGDVKI